MFKKVPFLIIFLLFCISVFPQNTAIPDNNFEMFLETHNTNLNVVPLGDANSLGDGVLNNSVPTNKVNSVQNLDITNNNISNLTGIQDFLALEILTCSDNQLTSIDISNNLNLRQLFIQRNYLTDLNVTNNLQLQILWCFSNQMTNLDITNNNELISLRCEGNFLTELNVIQNSKLNVLTCGTNQLLQLNLSNNTTLNRLECEGNLITSLDVTNCGELSHISCDSNQITNLDLSQNSALKTLICLENQLLELDLSSNSSLVALNCGDNNLCSLNIRNGNNHNADFIYFGSNPNLNCVVVDSPNGDRTNWLPMSFSNYVNSPEDCSNQIPVDELSDFIGTSYTLPSLTNGAYYSSSNGRGILLFPGEIIDTSQTIYIYNSTSCYSNESSFNVFISNSDYLIPKFFTPNSDGSHDTWKVIDNSNSIVSINIYNRYGKLIKSLGPGNLEWDGTFNGQLMHTDDYWYIINRASEQPIKGHFTLKQ